VVVAIGAGPPVSSKFCNIFSTSSLGKPSKSVNTDQTRTKAARGFAFPNIFHRTVARRDLAAKNEGMNTTCRYCNAVLDSAGNCPRCGESTGTSAPNAPKPPKRSNLRLGLLVVGAMTILFGAAVAFMLYTRSLRGGRPLAEAPALGYLPSDTNVIVAWNPSAAEPSKEAREFMERIGFADGGDLDPEKYFGIKRDQIEDVVIGVKLDLRLPYPDFRIIVRTKSAYDADAIRKKLGRTGSKPLGAKTVDTLSPPRLPIELVMWCATARTLVICHRPEDMEKIPDVPHETCDHLAAPIADLLKYRSDRDSFLWLVAHNDDWSKTLLAFLNLPADQRKTLFKAQTVGLALRPDRGAITSRNRPARVTEIVDPTKAGVALDLVLKAKSDENALDLRALIDGWFSKLQIDVRDSNLKETRYSATIAGSPKEIEDIVKNIRAAGPKGK
jgi:hypothetical protein